MIHMELSAEEFGPIKKGKIQVKPITVIIGRNCVGKSYLAELLYTMLTLRTRELYEEPLSLAFAFRILKPKDFERVIEEIAPVSSEQEIIRKLIDIILEKYRQYLERSLKTRLESTFGMEIDDLIRFDASKAMISFVVSTVFSIEITLMRKNHVSLNLEVDKEKIINEVLRTRGRITTKALLRIRQLKRPSSKVTPLMDILIIIGETLFKLMITGEKPSSVYYIPAGRAGLLESYNTVQSALLSLSPVAPIRGISMPPIPGPASHFYNVFLQLRGQKGPFHSVAKEFEEMLGGEILIKPLGTPKGKTVITYSFKCGDETSSIDIIHAASMVKELAPLYLIIKEVVRKGDFLIIEEPESHLHPGAQLQFMEVISLLVNKGIRVLITTHSDIVLRKLAQLTGVYRASKGEDRTGLNPEDLAVYLLKDSTEGSVSEPLIITGYGSFEEMPTFDEVIKELYEKEISLQSTLQMTE
ncbi:MAG: AAA family ATPase [Candidatus Bathyarchaeia archaeon]